MQQQSSSSNPYSRHKVEEKIKTNKNDKFNVKQTQRSKVVVIQLNDEHIEERCWFGVHFVWSLLLNVSRIGLVPENIVSIETGISRESTIAGICRKPGWLGNHPWKVSIESQGHSHCSRIVIEYWSDSGRPR